MNNEEGKNGSISKNGKKNLGQKLMKLFFIIHLYVFIAVNLILLGINLLAWQGFAWFPLVLLGWGTGLMSHYTLYQFSISEKIKALDAVVILHVIAYMMVNSLLVYINVSSLWLIYNFWFLLPLFGWGIGLTIHITINQLLKSDEKTKADIVFVVHLVAYCIVNLFLVYINLSIFWFSQYLWFLFPLTLWGIGILIHAISTKIIKNKELSGKDLTKLINKVLLTTNVIYYFAVNLALLFLGLLGIPQVLSGTLFSWPFAIALHFLYVGLFDYVENIVDAFKGVILHGAVFIAFSIAGLINLYIVNPQSININIGIFAATIWLIAIGVHLILAIVWERTDHDLKIMNRSIFVTHLIAYATTTVILVILNFTIFTGALWSIIVALGWLIGLSEHFTICLCYEKDVFNKIGAKGILKISTYLHLTAFVTCAILLTWINLAFGGFLWFIIALAGWGIGLGPHLIIDNLVNNQ